MNITASFTGRINVRLLLKTLKNVTLVDASAIQHAGFEKLLNGSRVTVTKTAIPPTRSMGNEL